MRTILLLFLPLGFTKTDAGIGWYTKESYRCQGLGSLTTVFVKAGWFGALDLVGTMPSAGKIHVRETANRVQRITSTGGVGVIDAHVLDSRSARSLRDVLESRSERTPYIIEKLTDLILGYTRSEVVETFLDGFIHWLTGDRKARTLPLSDLVGFVAVGGILEHTLAFYSGPDRKRYALSTNSYRVAVGQEERTFVVASCIYAVETSVKEFRTRGGINDKIVRPNGNEWHVFDVESGKYDRPTLNYQGQDEEYFYFKTDSDRRRISFRGGKWQTEVDNAWKTLYAQVDAL